MHDLVEYLSANLPKLKELSNFDYRFFVDGEQKHQGEPLKGIFLATTIRIETQMPNPYVAET